MTPSCTECAALLGLYRAAIQRLRNTVEASGSMGRLSEAWIAYEAEFERCENLREAFAKHAEAHGYHFRVSPALSHDRVPMGTLASKHADTPRRL